MPNSLKLRLPEVVVPGKRLGRHIGHDAESLRYLAAESAPASVSWDARIPVLDQDKPKPLGSCTGNATTSELGTEPFFDTVPSTVRLDEAFAIGVYSRATQLDSFPGKYPTEDTGSDGNSAAKAVRELGLASGWTHATSLAACYTFIKSGPFAIGISWLTGMDNPNAEGVVHPTGQVRGGHEVCVVAYDAATGLWKVRNSWSDSWGKAGYFFLPDEDLNTLLADQGDATQLTPITAPAPTPTPVPAGKTVTFTGDQFAAVDRWATHPHIWSAATAAAKAWTAAQAASKG